MNIPGVKITDEAVKKATGKMWEEWIQFLNKKGADKMTHTEIVAVLYKKHIEKGWWAQNVANGYEKSKGKRTVGDTQIGYEVGVRKTFPMSVKKAWEFVTSKKGVAIWLGDEINLKFEKGEKYETKDGVIGEVRVINPLENIRLTWQPKGWKKHSVIQIRVIPSGNGCVISFHQEQMPSVEDREIRRKYWQGVLDVIPS
jgi:activator of HSP90 ATPase